MRDKFKNFLSLTDMTKIAKRMNNTDLTVILISCKKEGNLLHDDYFFFSLCLLSCISERECSYFLPGDIAHSCL